MLENYYSKPQTIDRIRAHWLGEPIERYVTWLHDQGYAARNVFRRVPMLLHFGAYAQTRGAKTWSDLPPHVQGFVEDWVVRTVATAGRSGRERVSPAQCAAQPNRCCGFFCPILPGPGEAVPSHSPIKCRDS